MTGRSIALKASGLDNSSGDDNVVARFIKAC